MNIKLFFNKEDKYKIFQFGYEGKKYFDLLFKDQNNRFIYNLGDVYIVTFLYPKFLFNLFYYRSIKIAYFKTMFDILKIKKIITWLDNNGTFQQLDKKIKAIDFFAFQNGFRSHLCLTEKKIYHSNLFCFGQNDVDRYKKYGHNVKNFFPYGSLKLNLVIDKIKEKNEEIYKNNERENEIAFISEMPMDFMIRGNNKFEHPKMWPLTRMKSLIKLIKFTKLFLQKNKNFNLKILMRSNYNSKYYNIEKKFFNKLFGEKIFFNSNDNTVTKNYFSALKSDLIIGMKSTLLCELYGFGKKIVSFSFGYNKKWSIPINTFNIINNKIEFDVFENIINKVINMDHTQYLELTKNDRKYLMSNYQGFGIYRNQIFKKINGL